MTLHTMMRFDMRAPSFGLDRRALYFEALEMAAWADTHGIDRLMLSEHHGSDDGYCPAPAVLGAAMAVRTSHPDSGCHYASQPYVADRRTDAQITLRLDPDDHPLVWADHGDVIIALGDPGAGVAGVRTHVVVAGATARRWFSDLIGQLTPALGTADTQRDR